MKVKVAMTLARLGSGNSLQMCGKVTGIAKSTTSIIVKEFCVAIRKHLKPLVIPKLIRNKSKKLPLVLNVYMEFLAS
jgi:hypothetical protein